MTQKRLQTGFTAVELLITLFVAAAFLIASYQLFNLVIKDGGATRAESRVANVAYDYMRQYGASSTTVPCTNSTPLSDSDVSVDGLTNVTVDVTISCMPDAPSGLSRIQVDVHYNVPQQTVSYSTYVTGSTNSGTSDITNGLVAWFKLNGDATTAVNAPNAVVHDATSTTHSGVQDTAYNFNGSTASINAASTYGITNKNATLSLWVWNPGGSTNSGAFLNLGDGTNGFGVGVGAARYDNATPGSNLVMLFEGVRWITSSSSSAAVPMGTWSYIVMELDASGNPSAYINGVQVSGYSTGAIATPPSGSAAITAIGNSPAASARYFKGSIDDVRIYNRALSQAEIVTLYSNGAK